MQLNHANSAIRAIYTKLRKKITVGDCDSDTVLSERSQNCLLTSSYVIYVYATYGSK
jgi:hypothetical protein